MQNESGRSMVEMLGVLAVMGLVGLGGVKMYTNAMNKHRANELIYEAQKRATMVAAQLMAGRSADQLSLSEFTDPVGYHFGVNGENDQQFKITLTQVDEEICTKMKGNIGTSTPIRHISENCTEIIFNNDLSTIGKEQCTGGGKIWCANTSLCSATGACCGNKDCAANECPANSSTGGAGGTTGIFVNGAECKCESETAVYTGTQCETQPAECHNWTKNECGFGYYCQFSYSDEENLNPGITSLYDYTIKQCYRNLSGTCTKITGVTKPKTAQMKILQKAGFKSTFVSRASMNWWSAYSWCVGQGKHLLNIEDMECYSGTTLIKQGGSSHFCCKKGQSCQQKSWETNAPEEDRLWNGTEIISGKEAEVAKFSDKMVALKKVFSSIYFWTASSYRNTSTNACNAFYVLVPTGGLYGNGRSTINRSVICQ